MSDWAFFAYMSIACFATCAVTGSLAWLLALVHVASRGEPPATPPEPPEPL